MAKPIETIDHNSTINQKVKGKFVAREVYCCITSLVSDLLQKDENFEIFDDEIENMYRNVCPECGEDTREFNVAGSGKMMHECTYCEWEGDYPDRKLHEVFEWWAVSGGLFEKLRDEGQPVWDAGSCYVWGRCTTGQAIKLDWVISKIAAEMGILEGQENHKYWID